MHHQRKKSGQGLPPNNHSSTDLRKTVTATDPSRPRRPGLTRRHTPGTAQKLGRGQKERQRDWLDADDDERESFPQFCMTCEKQFVPRDDILLYCSDACRRVDQTSHTTPSLSVRNYNDGGYAISSDSSYEYKDIVPRASPSRPNSMLFSTSPPATPDSKPQHHHSSAMSALRSLSLRPPSPPSPTSHVPSGGMWPFSRSPNSPGASYSRPSAAFLSSTFDVGGTGGYGGSSSYGHDLRPSSMDRPLPVRNPSMASRPGSIELFTPMVSR